MVLSWNNAVRVINDDDDNVVIVSAMEHWHLDVHHYGDDDGYVWSYN